MEKQLTNITKELPCWLATTIKGICNPEGEISLQDALHELKTISPPEIYRTNSHLLLTPQTHQTFAKLYESISQNQEPLPAGQKELLELLLILSANNNYGLPIGDVNKKIEEIKAAIS